MIGRDEITGLVLAGGRGTRMGGVDKGLQLLRGEPLARHAIRRLAPQVGRLLISANRNGPVYESLGATVVVDALPGHLGPLAGILAGLAACSTPCLATVPCDAPLFPVDLVLRLAVALDEENAAVAMAATHEGGVVSAQPAFCLMRADVRAGLARFLADGGRKVSAWTSTLATAVVVFDDAQAFVNVNTLDDLRQLDD